LAEAKEEAAEEESGLVEGKAAGLAEAAEVANLEAGKPIHRQPWD
jgi:hypothetical protein